eukprot:TRINITY_DN19220_c0_g1_i1.p1 TRINITY_DN19220_c0_g1~~TRINITY_DN19220_c0_g1_i1.p1  ORF type:complete len:148 (+),score=32.56 TRINITY_DN19220_c0_g1_i1:87-530(+)
MACTSVLASSLPSSSLLQSYPPCKPPHPSNSGRQRRAALGSLRRQAFFNGVSHSSASQRRIEIRAQSEEKEAEPAPEKFVASKYSMNAPDDIDDAPAQKELSDAMKKKIRDEYLAFGGSPDRPLQGNPFLTISIIVGVLFILVTYFT